MPYPWQLRRAAQWLRSGGLLAYPTEAVYGLGCDPYNAVAVSELTALKGRPSEKGYILIAADWAQLQPLLALPDPALLSRMLATWPGPITWVVPAASNTPQWLTGGRDTLAVRVTAHPLCAALCRSFGGPLVSTSANPSGQPPACNAWQVRRYFPTATLRVLVGPTGGLDRPTAMFDARSGQRLR